MLFFASSGKKVKTMSTGPFSFATLPKVVKTILDEAAENHEREQMLNELFKETATSKESTTLRSTVDAWFQKTFVTFTVVAQARYFLWTCCRGSILRLEAQY